MSRLRVLQVSLAEAPTDVLVHLVDHGPTGSPDLMRLVVPDGYHEPALQLARAVGLLVDLGYVAPPPEPWTATPEGIAAVAAARLAARYSKEQPR